MQPPIYVILKQIVTNTITHIQQNNTDDNQNHTKQIAHIFFHNPLHFLMNHIILLN